MKGEKTNEKIHRCQSAKDSSRSLQVLILLGCERTENQFKEEHVGARLALPRLLPGCVSRDAAHGVGLEVGRRWWQCSSGVGKETASGIEAAEMMGAGRSTSEPE